MTVVYTNVTTYNNNSTIIIVSGTAQHIEQCTTPKRMMRITAVQDILELHHVVNVSEYTP